MLDLSEGFCYVMGFMIVIIDFINEKFIGGVGVYVDN